MKTIIALNITLILCLSFLSAQDTLFIMRSGIIVNKQAVANIDSIIFYYPSSSSSNIVIDYDGNAYQTVQIGTQVWMAENLRTTHYHDGTPIPLVTGDSNWEALITSDKAYCWYNDDSTLHGQTYGALYTWAAAMNGASTSNLNPSGIQGVCPTGWHLPSDAEWDVLRNFLDPNATEGSNIAGGKMKIKGLQYWMSPNTDATDESRFTALPGGCRNDYGNFYKVGANGYWWSSTETNTSFTKVHYLYYLDGKLSKEDLDKKSGNSVRCIKDN